MVWQRGAGGETLCNSPASQSLTFASVCRKRLRWAVMFTCSWEETECAAYLSDHWKSVSA